MTFVPSMKNKASAMIRSITLMLMLSAIAATPLRAQRAEGSGRPKEPVAGHVTAVAPTFTEALKSAVGKDDVRKGRKMLNWMLHRAEKVVKVTVH